MKLTLKGILSVFKPTILKTMNRQSGKCFTDVILSALLSSSLHPALSWQLLVLSCYQSTQMISITGNP